MTQNVVLAVNTVGGGQHAGVLLDDGRGGARR